MIGGLALLLAHLLSAFVLRSPSQTVASDARWVGPHLRNGLIRYLLALGVLGLFAPRSLRSPVTAVILVGLVILQVLVDLARDFGQRRGWPTEGAAAFLTVQLAHLGLVAGAGLLLSEDPAAAWPRLLQLPASNAYSLLVILTVYVAVVFGGGHLIRLFMAPFARKLEEQPTDDAESIRGLERAGLYIGWLERFLVTTAIVTNAPTAAGLIIAAKSVFRFPELKGRPFAEYFLIGTLLSVALAVLGGLLIRTALTA